MFAIPCTPPRLGGKIPRSRSTLNVPGLALRTSRSDNTLNSRRLSEDPAIHLEALLRHHRLPETHPCSTTRLALDDDSPDQVPSSHLRCSESLLLYISRNLAEVSALLAPQFLRPVIPGPCREDTDRFAENWDGLSERARLAANARRLFSSTLKDIEFMIKFFLRPANELMACMLLPTGYQVFWRLANRHLGDKPRLELVWRTNDIDEVTLCVLTVTTPEVVSDIDMRILVDNLRRGFLTVGKEGGIVVYSPLAGEIQHPWLGACKLASRAISDMMDNDAGLAIISNCNRFIVISKGSDGVIPVFNFSDVVYVSGMPDINNLCKAPFALFLGVAVHGLHSHDVKLSRSSRGITIPNTSLALGILLMEHFGPNLASKRHSHDAKFRRRAIFGEGMYPSQLGASLFYLRISPSYQTLLDIWNVPACCWAAPFHGPFQANFIPNLLPDATPLDPSWVPELEIVEFRGAGRIWHVFTVRFSWLKSADADVVVKVVNLTSFPDLAVTANGFGRDDAVAGIINELALYAGALHNLQGSVVPRFHGLLGSAQPDDTQQWSALFDDAGVQLSVQERHNPEVRTKIRRHYEALHDAGVLHNDIGWCHILRRPDHSTVWIIDFDRAVVRSGEDDDEWDRLCVSELEKVDLLLASAAFPPETQ